MRCYARVCESAHSVSSIIVHGSVRVTHTHTHTLAQNIMCLLVLYRHVEDIVPTIKLHYNKTRNDFDFLRVYYAYIYIILYV